MFEKIANLFRRNPFIWVIYWEVISTELKQYKINIYKFSSLEDFIQITLIEKGILEPSLIWTGEVLAVIYSYN